MKPTVLLFLPFLVLSVAQLNKTASGQHEQMAQIKNQKKAYACMVRSRIKTIDKQIATLAYSQNQTTSHRAQNLLTAVRQNLHQSLRMIENENDLNWGQLRPAIEATITDADIIAGK